MAGRRAPAIKRGPVWFPLLPAGSLFGHFQGNGMANRKRTGLEKCRKFWASVMNDGEARIQDRLKASELYARSEAELLEQAERAGGGKNLPAIVVALVKTKR